MDSNASFAIAVVALAGRAYDLTLADEHHERFLKQTQASQHSGKAKTEIIKIRRVMADDGKEYLVYDEIARGYDNLGNEHHSARPNIGRYPIPVARKELRMGPDMSTQEVTAEITRMDTGYSIPFSASNLEKLHKNANDKKQRGATQYYVQRGNNLVSVANYEAMKNGEFDQLEKYGMTLEQWIQKEKALATPAGEAQKEQEETEEEEGEEEDKQDKEQSQEVEIELGAPKEEQKDEEQTEDTDQSKTETKRSRFGRKGRY